MSKSIAKPTNSGTTGLLPLDSEPAKQIGQLLGALGVGRQLTTNAGLPRVPALPAGQAASTEETVDRVASWPKPLRSCVVGAKWRDKLPTDDSGWDGYPIGYEIAAEIPPDAAKLAAGLLAGYRQLCAPLSDEDAAREITQLRLSSVRKHEEEFEWAVILDLWLNDLSHYPADIVLWAVGYWRRNEKYWPVWSEFIPLLERRAEQRKAAMAALQAIAEPRRASQEATA